VQENNYPKVPLVAAAGLMAKKWAVVEVAAIRIRRKRKITE